MNSAYHRRVASPAELGSATSSGLLGSAPEDKPTLIVPVGSTEQHGPHLPLDTDTRIATAVARRLAARFGDGWLLAPAIGYGASGEHEGFVGTVSIGTTVLQLMLIEFGRSACNWAGRVAFVNGHGGNVEALTGAVALLRTEGRDVAWCSCTVAGADAHAGHTETSVLLHISPDDVRRDAVVPGNSAPLTELMPAMRAGGIAAVSAVGVLGDATTATEADGAQYFATMVDECARKLLAWVPNGRGMLT
ncbi:mycofactocin biosynthesis peptidyl-dipeptidase MftE [Mycobacterium sp. NPDC003323]